VKLDEAALALGVHKPESVYAKTFHHTKTPRYSPVREKPHNHMRSLRRFDNEVPKGVVGRRGLGNLIMRFRLDGVDYIRELNGILNEEYGYVVGHQVIITLPGEELGREAPNVAYGIS